MNYFKANLCLYGHSNKYRKPWQWIPSCDASIVIWNGFCNLVSVNVSFTFCLRQIYAVIFIQLCFCVHLNWCAPILHQFVFDHNRDTTIDRPLKFQMLLIDKRRCSRRNRTQRMQFKIKSAREREREWEREKNKKNMRRWATSAAAESCKTNNCFG